VQTESDADEYLSVMREKQFTPCLKKRPTLGLL